jgi:DNA-binding CsgD family transcriptional regulator
MNPTQVDLPILVVDLETLTVRAASTAALEIIGKPPAEVIGRSAPDLFGPKTAERCAGALEAVALGVVDFYRSYGWVANGDSEGPITVWVRALQLDRESIALVELANGDEPQHSPLVRYLGREPLEMAIGTANASWTITSISSDIEALLGFSAHEATGRSLLGSVQQDDVPLLLEADVRTHDDHAASVAIEMRHASGEWKRMCCVLTSLAGAADRYFILLPESETARTEAGRVSELEHHLWRIAAEVEASGILQRIGATSNAARLPQMAALSLRQWEVLNRLLRGDRVPTIAKELFVSQSTVRDHLSAIFERFGVHSQAELLALMRGLDGLSG